MSTLDLGNDTVYDILKRLKRYAKSTSYSDEELLNFIEDAVDEIENYGITGYTIGTGITPEPTRKMKAIIALSAAILARPALDIIAGETLTVKNEETSYTHSLSAIGNDDPDIIKLEKMINTYLDEEGSGCIVTSTNDFGVTLPSDAWLYGKGRS